MPFDFLKRKKTDGAGAAKPAGPAKTGSGRGIPFDGLTEEWRIVGNMEVSGRLSDALNKRESITISDVQWAPVNGSEPRPRSPPRSRAGARLRRRRPSQGSSPSRRR